MTDAAQLIERLARLETGQLCDVLAEAGLPDQALAAAIRHVSGGREFAGIALPARGRTLARTRRPIPVLANDALDEAVFPGAVILIDTGGFLGGGCLGGLIATGLRHKGAVAIVTDGAVRDAKEIGSLGLAAYAAAVTPVAASRRWSLIEVNQPIALPGVAAPVQVRPGDLVRGDDDGIVVVPAPCAAAILEDTEEVARIEERMSAALRAGEPRAEVFRRHPRFDHIRPALPEGRWPEA
jgi:4-hydroxy-4-methyl-2-oxoglutarate aldolase